MSRAFGWVAETGALSASIRINHLAMHPDELSVSYRTISVVTSVGEGKVKVFVAEKPRT